jgi:tRNA threonylcarbamoyladenosine biosynthesis protein TsaB
VWTLGLCTATWTASVGLIHHRLVVTERTVRCQNSHAPTLLGLIDDVLRDAGVEPDCLDAVAVSQGPGSFTGLRIGISTAKGLAYAGRARVVGVPTLEALVRAAKPRAGTVCAVLDARKGEVYASCFRWQEGRLVIAGPVDQAITPRHLVSVIPRPCTLIGDGVDSYRDLFAEMFGTEAVLMGLEQAPPSGVVVAEMGWERLEGGSAAPLEELEPCYVRLSEAERKGA